MITYDIFDVVFCLLPLQVRDFEKYKFKPMDLIINVTKIYLSLGIEDKFVQAVVKDKRSFSLEIFGKAVKKLE